MFIPLHDKNPLDKIRFQYVTISLIIINVLVYALFQSQWFFSSNILESSFVFALVPNQLASVGVFQAVPDQLNPTLNIPEGWTLLTYMFLHGNVWHLVGNMAFLWVFGDNVEDALGHFRFLIFYLLCGVLAGLVHFAYNPGSESALIGASGAVSGVIVAYLMLHPNIRVWVLAFWRIPLPLPAGIVLGFWIGMQFVFLHWQLQGKVEGNTAWMAHIGGIIAGSVLVIFMRRPGWKLFDFKH